MELKYGRFGETACNTLIIMYSCKLMYNIIMLNATNTLPYCVCVCMCLRSVIVAIQHI